MTMQQSNDVAVALALAEAVRAVGRRPGFGASTGAGAWSPMCWAPTRDPTHAEVDAVVLAAEEEIPDDLLAERSTTRGPSIA